MNELIQVGDEIKNFNGSISTVTSVVIGRHGLLVKGTFASSQLHEFYAPFELPSQDRQNDWFGWRTRSGNTILHSGVVLGIVSLRRSDCRYRPVEILYLIPNLY